MKFMGFLLELVKKKDIWLFILLLASNCQEQIWLERKSNEDLGVLEKKCCA